MNAATQSVDELNSSFLSIVEEIALLGLSPAKESGRSLAEVSKACAPQLGAKKEVLFTETYARLVEKGLVEEVPRAPRQRSVRWRLLPSGVAELERLLPGIDLKKRNARNRAFKVMAVAHTYGLKRTLACKLTERSKLVVFLLAKAFEIEFLAAMKLKSLAAQAAAKSLGSTDAKIRTLWATLINRAVSSLPASSAESISGTPAKTATGESLPHFAAQVLDAAQSADEGWFGDCKLFIHAAWKSWSQKASSHLDLPDFKQRLLQACRAGLVSLARADFTPTLDPAEVSTSEIRDGEESFNFVVVERRSGI